MCERSSALPGESFLQRRPRRRLSSADDVHGLPGNLPQFGAARAGTGADGDGMHRGQGEDRKRRGIGIRLQLASLHRLAETGFEIGVNHAQCHRKYQ